MPVNIEYTEDGSGVILHAVGKVVGSEVIRHKLEMLQGDRLPRMKYWIIDRSQCTDYHLSAEEVQQIAQLDAQSAAINPRIITALISETELQFGMSRMYESLVEKAGLRTGVFRDHASAETWIQNNIS